MSRLSEQRISYIAVTNLMESIEYIYSDVQNMIKDDSIKTKIIARLMEIQLLYCKALREEPCQK